MSPKLLWTGVAVLLAWLVYRNLPSGWTGNNRLVVAGLIWVCIETILILIRAYEDGRLCLSVCGLHSAQFDSEGRKGA